MEGETLDHYLYETMSGHVPIQEVLDFGIQLCNVLGYLHTRRPPIIFRDLKPLNIIRTPDGLLYLIDFGIARYFKIGRDRDTIPFGTSGYTAPELAYQQSNPSSDIYSLGVTLYELLTANDPMHNPIRSRSLRLHNRVIPTELEKLIMQMLDGDPRRRPTIYPR
jgi:eukaryotic-like serine/threonine-protein kinase